MFFRQAQRWLRRLHAALAAGIAFVAVVASSFADQATPGPGEFIPDPSDCRVAPRSEDEVRHLIGTPGPTYEDRGAGSIRKGLPNGSPTDAVTTAQITAAVGEVLACYNAGDDLRFLALFTDAFLYRLGPQMEENFERSTPSATVSPADWTSLVGVWDVLQITPDQVSAAVAVGNLDDPHPAPGRTYVFIFERSGNRWLVDELIERVNINGQSIYVADLVGVAPPGTGTPAAE